MCYTGVSVFVDVFWFSYVHTLCLLIYVRVLFYSYTRMPQKRGGKGCMPYWFAILKVFVGVCVFFVSVCVCVFVCLCVCVFS